MTRLQRIQMVVLVVFVGWLALKGARNQANATSGDPPPWSESYCFCHIPPDQTIEILLGHYVVVDGGQFTAVRFYVEASYLEDPRAPRRQPGDLVDTGGPGPEGRVLALGFNSSPRTWQEIPIPIGEPITHLLSDSGIVNDYWHVPRDCHHEVTFEQALEFVIRSATGGNCYKLLHEVLEVPREDDGDGCESGASGPTSGLPETIACLLLALLSRRHKSRSSSTSLS